jgi:hypothetical protein
VAGAFFLCFQRKNRLASALLNKFQKRVDSADEFLRVRELFAETTIKPSKAYEQIQ